ncbi:MAG: CapA family protein [Patescibacteria group bacterium]
MKKVYFITFVFVILFGSFFLYEKREVKILFVGDMNFDRYIRQVGENKGEDFVFSCISNFLKDSDLVVGNLEGPITDNSSVSLGSVIESSENYTFTFPPNTAKLLAKNNIKLVNLGNNHIGNFGNEGITSTKKYLNKAGVNYLYNNEIYRTKIGGTKISFISFNEFGGDSPEKVAQSILEEKANKQMVFVYAHWGDEYIKPPKRVKDNAKMFAETGADLIIGSHPHIILPSDPSINSWQEKYQTIVYYSLGNFIFDQYWNKDVSTGLVLEVDIKNGELSVIEHQVSLNRDGRTCLVN